ncbi:ATP-dependent protease LonB [Candidatus Micrarchaeota archaeon]|nr:ATP-dependent protease LonB [Candidatus Micrarchaeota archaeon]
MADKKHHEVNSTADVKVSAGLVDQIVGQERAVSIIRKAARQKRNVLLVGFPGTGKSMLAQAMSELMPVSELEDVLVMPNPDIESNPQVKVLKAGEGKKQVQKERLAAIPSTNLNLMISIFMVMSFFFLLYFGREQLGDVITAALLILMGLTGIVMIAGAQLGRARFGQEAAPSKLLVDNSGRKTAPFIEATGARSGALLGDCKHDPFQSGGLGTPPHMRVEAGLIHKANKGVLFIDEVSSLSDKSQQELLTAMQEKKYAITGQSEMSSGALVRSQPVPCDFVLIAAGNYNDIQRMHPALRSRIRGYGYEVFMEETMPDNEQNQLKIMQFIAQEVKRDGKIPHFDGGAINEILKIARKMASRKNKLTLKLRELGGLVRASGDYALEKGAAVVQKDHVVSARKIARTLEQQMAEQTIELKKDYQIFLTTGTKIGKVNGLAVMGDSGVILPIVAEVAPSASREESHIIATGKLGDIAKEAVENVSAIIKRHTGKDTSNYDIHIQFLQTYEGVEGDSASISVACAVISAIEEVPVRQDLAMTGSLSVRGEVLPVGGVTQKIEAAIEAGLKEVLIPETNLNDVLLDDEQKKQIRITPVRNIYEVLRHGLAKSSRRETLLKQIAKEFNGKG